MKWSPALHMGTTALDGVAWRWREGSWTQGGGEGGGGW